MADDQDDVKRVSNIIVGFAEVIATLVNTLDSKGVLARSEFRDALADLWEKVPDEADNREVRWVVGLFLEHLQEPDKDV